MEMQEEKKAAQSIHAIVKEDKRSERKPTVLRERILHGKQVQQQFCKCFIIQ
jgi:hypothetical protein